MRFERWGCKRGMWGCRVVEGYTLGIVLGRGIVEDRLVMFLDCAVRRALFY